MSATRRVNCACGLLMGSRSVACSARAAIRILKPQANGDLQVSLTTEKLQRAALTGSCGDALHCDVHWNAPLRLYVKNKVHAECTATLRDPRPRRNSSSSRRIKITSKEKRF
jgi:hypothetical protein